MIRMIILNLRHKPVYVKYSDPDLKTANRTIAAVHFAMSKFMFRAGAVARTTTQRKYIDQELGKLEKRLRLALKLEVADVQPVCPMPAEKSKGSQPTVKPIVVEDTSLPLTLDAHGCVLKDDTTDGARSKGFKISTKVTLSKGSKASGLKKGAVGTITAITPNGKVTVSWDRGESPAEVIPVEVGDIEIEQSEEASKKKNEDRDKPKMEPVLPVGVPYVSSKPCQAVSSIVETLHATIWQMYASNAPSPETVRLVPFDEGPQAHSQHKLMAMAAKDLQPGALKIIPFGSLVLTETGPGPQFVPMVVSVPGAKKIHLICDCEEGPDADASSVKDLEKGQKEVSWFRFLRVEGLWISEHYDGKLFKLKLKPMEFTAPVTAYTCQQLGKKPNTGQLVVNFKYLTNDRVVPAGSVLFG